MLPSFYVSGDKVTPWSVPRAAAVGAAVGFIASLLKTLTPIGAVSGARFLTNRPEIAGATLGFALLCAAAAVLRNFIAQRLV